MALVCESSVSGGMSRPKAISKMEIVQFAVSKPISLSDLCGQIPNNVELHIELDSAGYLNLDTKSERKWPRDVHWIRSLSLSDDCHSYNVELRFDVIRDTMFLQTVKRIEAERELILWFSNEISMLLQIAFLTPANIRGESNYVCTKCSRIFESPNPLKLHITFNCNNNPEKHLWRKLVDLCNGKTSAIQTRNESFISNGIFSAFKPFTSSDKTKSSTDETTYDAEAEMEKLVSCLGKSKDGHVCLYCGKSYSRKYSLKIHIRTHTGYKPLRCKFCLRPFGDPSNLNKHIRLHSEARTQAKT